MAEETTEQTNTQQTEVQIEPGRMEYALEILRSEQSMPVGVLAGVIAAHIGAAIWAAVTVATGYQIGWMAVGVGILVGFAVRIGGKGIDKMFGLVGAALAFIGCLFGNLFAVCGMVAAQESMAFSEVVGSLNFPLAVQLMSATFSPLDLLFYGIAIYEGYKFSFRQLTDQDIARVLPEMRSKMAA
jgi:hypothetical protein